MADMATIGYLLSTLAFLVLTILLATAWRGRMEGTILLAASAVSVLWAGLSAYQASSGYSDSVLLVAVELLRDITWLMFLIAVLSKGRGEDAAHPFVRGIAVVSVILVLVVATVLGLVYVGGVAVPVAVGFDLRIFASLGLALIGLVLVEQLFRNTPLNQRWTIKYLCLGLGAMFAFDFYLYSDALLLKAMDQSIWAARGFIDLMVVPLVAVSAARNPQWSLDVHVSRAFVFHSAALLGAGLYLLVMAAGGYYIKLYGGDWGGAIQLIFFFGAGLLLLMLMFSGQMRARLRIFLSKHFFNYRYDYREEWLRLINTLSGADLDASLRPRVISAIAQIVESPAGMLWWRQDDQTYRPVAGWNMGEEVDFQPEQNRSLEAFLSTQVWVIDLDEIDREPESYAGLEPPAWLEQLPHAWLIVPLHSAMELSGFVVLSRPRARMLINWEVRDLLVTTGRQAASYLALLEANEALVDARQFEAFNRLSAYVVHDLKNLVAQLSLVVSNAARHRDNPAFLEDAISTVDNAVNKMNRLLAQLRKGRLEDRPQRYVYLDRLLSDVVHEHGNAKPVPQLDVMDHDLSVVADADRLAAVMGHMIQNAQDATADDGSVTVRLRRDAGHAVVDIEDTGSGMDAQFIRERLFRPFDTTKGNAGMGIGVYESREFILRLGGRLDVRSELGKGTCFTLRLKIEEAARDRGDASLQTTTVVD